MNKILIIGATGTIGSATIQALINHKTAEFQIVAGVRSIKKAKRQLPLTDQLELRHFDFDQPQTFQAALQGIDRILLVRPPAISDVKQYIFPFLEKVKAKGVEQIVFLSLQGVENNPIVPHYKLEQKIQQLGLPYTFLRPSFFMQNLSSTHKKEIRDHNELFIPAGNGKTNFIDVRDIAAVAALVLTEQGHLNKAYELTGARGYTYFEIAELLSDTLNRKIVYKNPSILRFFYSKLKEGLPFAKIMVMIGLYTVAKLGKANHKTNQVQDLLNRPPTSLKTFIEDYQEIWK